MIFTSMSLCISISPKILTRGGIQGERKWDNKYVPISLFFLRSLYTKGTYDIEDVVWKIRNLYQR